MSEPTREELYDAVEDREPGLLAQLVQDGIERAIERERASRDAAYNERNRLVALLAAIFPSWRTRHPDSDTEWDDDWRTIIGIQLPSGQCTWHVHDSEVGLFEHVHELDVPWDGHTTERKYERVAAAIQPCFEEKIEAADVRAKRIMERVRTEFGG